MHLLRSVFWVAAGVAIACAAFAPDAAAQSAPTSAYRRAVVVAVKAAATQNVVGRQIHSQDLQLRLTTGPRSGEVVDAHFSNETGAGTGTSLSVGDKVVVTEQVGPDGTVSYFIADRYRLDRVFYAVIIFAIAVAAIAGRRGIGALLGLALSGAVIVRLIVPGIVDGHNPLLMVTLGAPLIAVACTYLAHGVSRQTTVALGATLACLLVAFGAAAVVVHVAHLTGLGSEDASALAIGSTSGIDFHGLLLAGIVIGTLGALNDVTTTQSATVFELAQTDPSLTFDQLARRSFAVGREHITSLVNTIVLAYAGSGLAVFIFIDVNPTHAPWWVLLNSEFLAEEIIRTVVGSLGLLLAVPLTTIVAAWLATTPGLHRSGGTHAPAGLPRAE